jgi:lipid-binding SYLF domain-containing protein
VNDKKNKEVYGADVARERILDGTVKPPEPMQVVYRALDEVIAKANAGEVF